MGDDRLETVVLAAEAVHGDDRRLGVRAVRTPSTRSSPPSDLDLAPLDGDRVEQRGVGVRDGHPSSLRVRAARSASAAMSEAAHTVIGMDQWQPEPLPMLRRRPTWIKVVGVFDLETTGVDVDDRSHRHRARRAARCARAR